jgi:hypothetical protein
LSGLESGLAVFGFSAGALLLVMVAMIVIHVVSVQVGALVAGLGGTTFRAAAVLGVTILVTVPIGLVLVLVAARHGEGAMAFASSTATLLAETIAIKWLYRATWARAALAYLTAGALTAAGISVLLLAVY